MALSFYDIDKDYVKYLQKEERNERGFTRVPNIEYPRNLPKFTCGVVLDVHGYKYYVPVCLYFNYHENDAKRCICYLHFNIFPVSFRH